MSDNRDCPVGCGRPCSLGKEFCLKCWQRVPIREQRELYLLAQTIRAEPNNVKHQYAYQLALDRAVTAASVTMRESGAS